MRKNYILSKDFYPEIKENLNNNQIISLKVSGNSMRPFLVHQKSMVKLLLSKSYRKFDIVLYENSNNQLVLKRIIKVTKYLVIGSDALKEKESVHIDKVYGKVIYISYNKQDVNIHTKWYRIKVRLWIYLKPLSFLLLRFSRR